MSTNAPSESRAHAYKYRILVKNSTYCKTCNICIELCPKHALDYERDTRKVMLVSPDDCNGCGLCEFLCPDYVLMLVENDNGGKV